MFFVSILGEKTQIISINPRQKIFCNDDNKHTFAKSTPDIKSDVNDVTINCRLKYNTRKSNKTKRYTLLYS